MCFFLTVLLLGPRAGILFWWLVNPGRWSTAFTTALWPVLGFILVPWTTLMFVIVAPFGNVAGWDWFWLGLALLMDFGSYASGFGNRNRVAGYA